MTVMLSVVIMMVAALFLSLRLIFGKDDEVRKPGCANANAFMDQQTVCPICGVNSSKECKNPSSYENENSGT